MKAALAFVGGLLTFWFLIMIVGLLLAGSHPIHAPVPEQQAVEQGQREARQAADYEEEVRQARFHDLDEPHPPEGWNPGDHTVKNEGAP